MAAVWPASALTVLIVAMCATASLEVGRSVHAEPVERERCQVPRGRVCAGGAPQLNRLCTDVIPAGAESSAVRGKTYQQSMSAVFALPPGSYVMRACLEMDAECHGRDARPRCVNFSHPVRFHSELSRQFASQTLFGQAASLAHLVDMLIDTPTPGDVVVFAAPSWDRRHMVRQLATLLGSDRHVHVFDQGVSITAPAPGHWPTGSGALEPGEGPGITFHAAGSWSIESVTTLLKGVSVAAAVVAFEFSAGGLLSGEATRMQVVLDPVVCAMQPGSRVLLRSVFNTGQEEIGMYSWWGRLEMEHSLQATSLAWFTHHLLLELKSHAGGCIPWKPPQEAPAQHADSLWRGVIKLALKVMACRHQAVPTADEAIRTLREAQASEAAVAQAACAVGEAMVTTPLPPAAGPTSFTPVEGHPSLMQRFALLTAWLALSGRVGQYPTTTTAADVVNVALRTSSASAPLVLAGALLREADGDYNAAARHWHDLVHTVQHSWARRPGVADLRWLLRLACDDGAWAAAHVAVDHSPLAVPLWPSKLRHDAQQLRALSDVRAPGVLGGAYTWADVGNAFDEAARRVEEGGMCDDNECPSVRELSDSVTESAAWEHVKSTYGRAVHANVAPALCDEAAVVLADTVGTLRGVPVMQGGDVGGAAGLASSVLSPQAWDAIARHFNTSVIWHDTVVGSGGSGAVLGSSPWHGVVTGVLLHVGAELAAVVARVHAELTAGELPPHGKAEAWAIVPGSARAFKVLNAHQPASLPLAAVALRLEHVGGGQSTTSSLQATLVCEGTCTLRNSWRNRPAQASEARWRVPREPAAVVVPLPGDPAQPRYTACVIVAQQGRVPTKVPSHGRTPDGEAALSSAGGRTAGDGVGVIAVAFDFAPN